MRDAAGLLRAEIFAPPSSPRRRWRGLIGSRGRVLAILLCLSTVGAGFGPRSAGSDEGENGRPRFADGEVLVAFDPAAGPEERRDVRRRHRLEHLEDLPLPGLERTRMHGRGRPPDRAKEVRRERSVRHAQPNHLWYADSHGDGLDPPNDPDFPRLWGLHNEGQTGGTHGADIDYLRARQVASDSEGIVAAVIDTGADVDHPDLAANIWLNTGELPLPQAASGRECDDHDCNDDGVTNHLDYADDPRIGSAGCLVGDEVMPSSLRCAFSDGEDDDGNGFEDDVLGWDFRNGDNDPDDGHSHGTHVSGTLAAVTGNDEGVSGVSRARVMPLKFLSADGGGTTSDAVKALDYAITMGAQLTNNSWGSDIEDEALSDKILEAHDDGQLFVASAGNAGKDIDGDPADRRYPASFNHPNMITVAATTHTDDLASYSNYGSESVHLGAPGGTRSDDPGLPPTIYSTVPGGYGSKIGTSMAAPHVAGAAAQVFGGYPGIGHIDVKDRVIGGGDPLATLEGKTVSGKRLNLAGSLDTDGALQLANLSVSPDPFDLDEHDHTSVGWSQSEPGAVTVRVRQEGSGTPLRTEDLGGRSAGDNTWMWDGTDDAGTDVDPDTYEIEIEATDVVGNSVADTVTVTVEAQQGEANLSVSVEHSDDPVSAGKELTYEARVRNLGDSTADNVRTRATLPAELGDVSLSGPAAGACSYDSGTHAVGCELGDLEDGAVRRVTVTGRVHPQTPDGTELHFTYEAQSRTPDPDTDLRSFTRTTTVVNDAEDEANLKVTVEDSDDPVAPGEELTYDMEVRNLGPSAAEDVWTWVEQLPEELTGISLGGPDAGDCSYHSERHAVTCDFGDVPDGAVREVLVTGVVDPGTPDGTELRLTYEARSPTPDPDPDLRTFTRTTTVASG